MTERYVCRFVGLDWGRAQVTRDIMPRTDTKGESMARLEEVIVTLIDDFDGSEATETVRFAIDGKTFEIDLSKPNANELRKTLRPYIERARGVRGTAGKQRGNKAPNRGGASRRLEGYDRTEVRSWAKANRIRVSPRGRIANDVVERWRKAVQK
jgi:Lsr2